MALHTRSQEDGVHLLRELYRSNRRVGVSTHCSWESRVRPACEAARTRARIAAFVNSRGAPCAMIRQKGNLLPLEKTSGECVRSTAASAKYRAKRGCTMFQKSET